MYQLTTSEKLTRNMIAAIVTAVEMAQKRVPDEYSDFTFFARGDTWIYHAVFDVDICALCQAAAVPFTYSGLHLRREFPYLEISSVNNIFPRVHPNCRCWLERSSPLEEPEVQFDIAVDSEVENPELSRRKLNTILNGLPSTHTEDVMSGFRVVKKTYHNYGEYDGVEIRVREDVLEEEHAWHVVYHEVGHHVWYDDLTYDDRAKWRRIWHRAPMPTQYAKFAPRNQVEEGFAECYSIYYNKSSKFKLFIEVERFIEEVKDRRG